MSGQLIVELTQEHDTIRLGQDVAAVVEPGDMIAVSGDLGVGKSVLIRAAIRALANDSTLDVPSPTFALRIDYELDRLHVLHSDLYRLSDPVEADELGLDDLGQNGALFIEWPERVPTLDAANCLRIHLTSDLGGRRACITPSGTWTERLDRTNAIRAFINRTDFAGADRTPIAGDASGRAYERIGPNPGAGATAILMNASAHLSGEVAKQKSDYDRIVHRSDDPAIFVAIANALRAEGFRAPSCFAADYDRGFILLEDFGQEGIIDQAGRPVRERYLAAMSVLASLHGLDLPTTIPLPDGRSFNIPTYDHAALLTEVAVFFDWVIGEGTPPFEFEKGRDAFLAAWGNLLQKINCPVPTWVLRDYHSPNIFWRSGELAEDGDKATQIAVIDFQDMVLGHPAYDCVSLGQDARVTISPALESDLLSAYFNERSFSDLERREFERDYAILGAQRASKIMGAFHRFEKRDGNATYLRHVERVRTYLVRNLDHPDLATLRALYSQII